MSNRAVIYARVSTDERAGTGYGLSYQIDQCISYAMQHKYTINQDPITEDYSGNTAFRPGINTLLTYIEAYHIDVVIMHRTDRLGRCASVQDTLEAEIEARGARIEYVMSHFDRTTDIGRLMRRVQGTFDQCDYENIITRLKEHKAEAARRGSIIGGRPPYGYSPGSRGCGSA